jgi:hypothetical protein
VSTISHKGMRQLGWTRVDGGKGKVNARWLHTTGWVLAHCGHPTALHPWMLVRPDDRLVCTGVLGGHPPNFGHAWNTLREAAEWYARFLWSGAELAAEVGPSHFAGVT